MKKRRRAARFFVFLAIVVGALVLVAVTRRGPRRTAGAEPAAGGGGGEDEPDAIIEGARRYAVRSWSFPLDRWELAIEDAAMTTALDGVLTNASAELVVNAGFFGPDGKAVGLAVSDGVILTRLSKTLSGGVLISDGAEARLFATEAFDLRDAAGDTAVRFALQCRPRLVVDKAINIKSDDGKRAERTALCLRDGGKVVDVIVVRASEDGESPGPSLYALARFLARSGCEGALNLDGGPSTGVAWREDGGIALIAPRAPIRYAVAFRERHTP